MINSKKFEDGTINLSFNLNRLDSYLQKNHKILKGDELIDFQTEIKIINEFTLMVQQHLQSIKLFYMLEGKDETSFLASIDGMYHQFLKNLLLNDKDYDKLLDTLNGINKVIIKDFKNLEI